MTCGLRREQGICSPWVVHAPPAIAVLHPFALQAISRCRGTRDPPRYRSRCLVCQLWALMGWFRKPPPPPPAPLVPPEAVVQIAVALIVLPLLFLLLRRRGSIGLLGGSGRRPLVATCELGVAGRPCGSVAASGVPTPLPPPRSPPRKSQVTQFAPQIDARVSGFVKLTEEGGICTIEYTVRGLPPGEHGFHIHETADFSNGCQSAGPHYNPFGEPPSPSRCLPCRLPCRLPCSLPCRLPCLRP